MALYSHLLVSVIALAVTLAVSALTLNRLVKRKLRLSTFLFGLYALAHLVFLLRPDLKLHTPPTPENQLTTLTFERLALAAGIINLFVVTLLNPLRADRIPDRFPSIVQDAIVMGTFLLVATFVFGDAFLATSAVGAAIVGFALQDTLGNAFAGLAIQSEKPFSIGHWVTVGEHEGRVAEVTWRATKLRTKTGNFVIVPNSEVGKAAITNYSEPAAPMRLFVDVGVSYDARPTYVKAVIRQAVCNCPLVLKAPAPDAMIHQFADSAITYRIRFWIENFELDEEAADQVRGAIYYAFQRHGVEIPYPIAIEMSKEAPVLDPAAQTAHREGLLTRVDLFAPLTPTQRAGIAAQTRLAVFGAGETIVRKTDPGDSMFVIASGRVTVRLDGADREVASLGPGDYFGEMSMLTGDPRAATVVAADDVTVLEIDAGTFRRLAEVSPQAVEQVGVAAAARRAELDDVRAASRASALVETPDTFLTRMRKFLRI